MKCGGLDKIILAKLLNLLFHWANLQDIFLTSCKKKTQKKHVHLHKKPSKKSHLHLKDDKEA